MTQSPSNQPQSLDLIYELTEQRLQDQLRDVEAVDEKLRLVFGVSSIVIGILVASFPSTTAGVGIRWLALLAPIVAYFVIIVLGIKAYRFLSLEYPPDVGAVYEEALFWDPQALKRQVLANRIAAVDQNNSIIIGKIKRASIALWLIPLEAVTAVGAAIAIHFD